MIPLRPPLAALALAQAVLDRPDDLERWVAIISGIATIVIALALIATFLAVIPIAVAARRAQKRFGGLLDRLEKQAEPVMLHAQSVADNVDFMSTAIRSDVERLKQTVDLAQDRLEQAAGAAEERISRFNALLDVVQDEAENLFIGTASTLRGVKAGAERLRGPSPDLAQDDYEYDEDEEDLPANWRDRPRRHL